MYINVLLTEESVSIVYGVSGMSIFGFRMTVRSSFSSFLVHSVFHISVPKKRSLPAWLTRYDKCRYQTAVHGYYCRATDNTDK